MSWIGIDWGIVGGILFSAAILLLSMLMLYCELNDPRPGASDMA